MSQAAVSQNTAAKPQIMVFWNGEQIFAVLFLADATPNIDIYLK